MSEVADYRGDAERYVKGDVRGWAFDVRGRNFDLPLTIYIDGRLAWYKRQTVSRPGLAAKMGVRGTAGRGFEASIPLGLFRHSGAASVEVDVRIAGTNVNLGRTPFDLPTDAEALVWERGRGWVVADPAELSAPAPTGPASPKEGRPGERVPVALRGRDRLRAAAAVAAGTARKRLTGGTES
jgi:hypothetical protein